MKPVEEGKAESGYVLWCCRMLAAVISAVSIKPVAGFVLHYWQDIKGWEAYWIAQAFAAGNGYSFPASNRWLFDMNATDVGFYPTAWVDPLYTTILAGIIWLFGDYHKLAAGLFNLFLLSVVFAFTYRLGERLISAPGGVLAVLLLAIQPFSALANTMNNTMLAAGFIVLSALFLTNYLEAPGYGRAAFLGMVLGLTVLACPSAQFFIPVTFVSVIFWGRQRLKLAVPQALLVMLMAVIVVLPWTVRNYLMFDEIVPVRNGSGQIAFVGTVAIAATVVPDRLGTDVKPEWLAKSPRSAVFQSLKQEKRSALERFQSVYAKHADPPGYADMNEAQRDKWFLHETKQFIIDNPVLSIKFAIAKIEIFIRSMGTFGIWTFLLSVLAGLLAFQDARIVTLALWGGSFVGPFVLVIIYFGRYRAPIEPVLVVLAAFFIWWACRRVFRSLWPVATKHPVRETI